MIVTDTRIQHIRELSDTIRLQDKLEIERLGFSAKKIILYSFQKGIYRKTALIGDKVAAIWGVCGTPLGLTGTPYLLTSDTVLQATTRQFVNIYKQETQKMLSLFPRLENYVDSTYVSAQRVLRLTGFTLEGPIMINSYPFYKFYKEAA